MLSPGFAWTRSNRLSRSMNFARLQFGYHQAKAALDLGAAEADIHLPRTIWQYGLQADICRSGISRTFDQLNPPPIPAVRRNLEYCVAPSPKQTFEMQAKRNGRSRGGGPCCRCPFGLECPQSKATTLAGVARPSHGETGVKAKSRDTSDELWNSAW